MLHSRRTSFTLCAVVVRWGVGVRAQTSRRMAYAAGECMRENCADVSVFGVM